MKFQLYIIIIYLSVISTISYSQKTFSVTYDFQANDVLVFPIEIIQINKRYYILSTHVCLEEPYHFCTGLTKISSTGEILKKKLFNNFRYSGLNSFVKYKDGFLISGHRDTNFRVTTLLSVDTSLNLINIYNTDSIASYTQLNTGILHYRGDFYVYGWIGWYGPAPGVYLIKLSGENFETLWYKGYSENISGSILAFDTLSDNKLVYINAINGAGPNGPKDFKIMVLDTSGKKIDSFDLTEYSIPSNFSGFTTDDSNNVYFPTRYSLTEMYARGAGTITKINVKLNTLYWSKILPRAPVLTTRDYRSINYYFYNNSILGCGISSTLVFNPPVGYMYEAFIVKLNLEGEIQWIRFYRIPQTKSAPDNVTGIYEFGAMLGLIPNSYGGYTACGYSQYYTDDTMLQVDNWVLSVDKDGCIAGEECEQVIIIDGMVKTNHKFVNPLNEWSILVEEDINGKSKRKTIRYRFSSDSTTLDGENYFELLKTTSENGAINIHTGTYYRENGGKVWKKTSEGEELLYDFNLFLLDTFYIDTGTDTIVMWATGWGGIYRDTMLDGSTRKSMPLVSIDKDDDCKFRWISGIGSLTGFPFDDRQCIDPDFKSTLLCYSYDGELLYKNDTIEGCYIVNTTSPKVNNIAIYPNPLTNKLNIVMKGRGKVYVEICDILVRSVYSGMIHKPEATILTHSWHRGIYFITIKAEGEVIFTDKVLLVH